MAQCCTLTSSSALATPKDMSFTGSRGGLIFTPTSGTQAVLPSAGSFALVLLIFRVVISSKHKLIFPGTFSPIENGSDPYG